jgi:RNA polymerase sigma-70 factor (ECF subfamily)
MDAPSAMISDDLPDDRLVGLVRAGKTEAFAAIMKRNNQRLFRLTRAVLGNDHEAEEVVQETYVRAFAALEDWRGEGSLSTWLSRIALNEALGLVRKRRHTVAIEDVADATPQPTSPFEYLLHPSPEADAARSEIRALLEREIDRLPPEFRSVFVMRAVELLTVEETAAALNILPITVRTRFFRARRMLRKSLGERFARAFEESFPFAGARCDRLIESVLAIVSGAGAKRVSR